MPVAGSSDVPPELLRHPKFHILRELGRGGMGVVYQARQTAMDRQVVIKVVNRSLLNQPGALDRFRREVQAAAQLSHPNIVTAYDAEQAGELHMLVMEFVPGHNLAEVLEKKGPLPVASACHYVRQVAAGLQHAHERGMVHRDIKPSNLMLMPKGQVKILDFGLAKLASERRAGKGLTASDAYMGTPEYCAPEQAIDARTADIRADLYSLGCTLYCLLAGRPPFREDTAMKTILAHIEKQPQPLPELRPGVPERLWAVVARLLAKDPAQRYQKPVEVVQALAPFVKPGAKPGAGRGPAPSPGVGSPRRGSSIDADASQSKRVLRDVSGKAPPREVPAKDETSPFADLVDAPARPGEGARGSTNRGWYRGWLVLAGVSLLLLALVGMLASGVFKVKTKDGTIVLKNLPADADVTVDGGRVTVTGVDGQTFEVSVAGHKKHRLEVKRDGFKVFVKELEIDAGGRKPIVVVLEPIESQRSKDDKDKPEQGGEDKAKWVELFNGKDLTGWKKHPSQPGNWRVEKGILIGAGATSHLYSVRDDYKDFHLRVEARINDGGNSGVFFRSQFGPGTPQNKGAPWPFGYEAEIWGSFIYRSTGMLYGGHYPGFLGSVNELPITPGEWFTMEVIAEGNHLVIKLNGQTTSDYTDEERRFTKGHIVLQQYGEATDAQFRKVEIKELP
jgi:serine/threonine protein kinase